MRFELYLESGPQHRKTWVFVPGLPGCVAVGPTTDAAIEIARSAIAERLDFLRRHGETMAGSRSRSRSSSRSTSSSASSWASASSSSRPIGSR